MRTYRVNRPTSGKGRSAGSNARVVCSTLLCAMPIRQGIMPFPLSAHRLRTRPPLLYMRAWNQRIRESARLLRVMCSHAWYSKAMGRDKILFFALPTARTYLPRTASCDSVAYAEGVQKRNPFLFLSFSYFSDKRKVLYVSCTFA